MSPAPPRERRIVFALAAAFAVGYSIVGLFRHWHFGSSYDLAIFDQAIWHLSRLEPPASTVSGHSNILGDHFSPILVLFALPYRLVPGPETLIVLQSLLLAVSVVPVWMFLRDRLDRAPALWMTGAYGLFWGLQRTAMTDVHELAFAPLLIAVAVLAVDRRRWAWLWTSAGLLMLVKEDQIPIVTGIGVYLVLTGERRRGLWLCAVSLAFFVLVVRLVIPAMNDGGDWAATGSFSTFLERPWTAPILLVSPPEKLRTILNWLAPFLLLPLASRYALLLLPIAAERLLSDISTHWAAGAHYSAPLAPILAMSAGDGLARVGQWIADPARRRRATSGVAALCALVASVVPGHQPLFRAMSPKHYRTQAHEHTAPRALALIPADASVVAQAALAPHLSRRDRIYILQAGPRDASAPAEYVIAAVALAPWPSASTGEMVALIDERRRNGYRTIFDEDGWLVLRR